jgi:hypothetical protein
MPVHPFVGRTVALTLCDAWDTQGNDVVLSGLFDVEDLELEDRSAAILGSSFQLVPQGLPEACLNVEHAEVDCKAAGIPPEHFCEACDPPWYSVDADRLFEQADPGGYGHNLAEDRHHEAMMEEECLREGFELGYGAWRIYNKKEASNAQQ